MCVMISNGAKGLNRNWECEDRQFEIFIDLELHARFRTAGCQI